MFDLWLTKSNKVIDEVIKESNLKAIVKLKVEEFMKTDEYNKFVVNCIKNNIKQNIEDYFDTPFGEETEIDKAVADIIKHIKIEIKSK